MRARFAPLAAAVLLAAVALMPPPAARAADSPEIRSVEPGRDGTILTAHVRSERLPGDAILSSLDSGMPSAIELRLRTRDDREHTVTESSVLLRIVYDLWDEVYRLQSGATTTAFPDVGTLRRFLEDLPHVPVTPFARLVGDERHRIGVACRLHPIAPRETERLERWVAGTPDREEEPDGREVSVGLGDVIRFFYKGAKREKGYSDERFSPWFVPDELPDAGAAAGGGGAAGGGAGRAAGDASDEGGAPR